MPIVADLMTVELATASPDTAVDAVAAMMRDVGGGSIPIMDGEELVGIVTDRDIAIRCVAEGLVPADTAVSEIMTRDPISVRIHDDPDGALAMMREYQVRRLPVLDAHGKLVGLLPIGKLARSETPSNAGETLQVISEPTGD
ncbi:MAG: CBS domain-containing protein [Chloroflexota bacterium]|jgi:CBS domain-containing protein